jgi:hypothetical protein
MPREMHPFHLHTLDEVDFAQRIWGAAGVRAILAVPGPETRLPQAAAQPAAPPSATRRAREPRVGFVWGWLRRAPRAAVR